MELLSDFFKVEINLEGKKVERNKNVFKVAINFTLPENKIFLLFST